MVHSEVKLTYINNNANNIFLVVSEKILRINTAFKVHGTVPVLGKMGKDFNSIAYTLMFNKKKASQFCIHDLIFQDARSSPFLGTEYKVKPLQQNSLGG